MKVHSTAFPRNGIAHEEFGLIFDFESGIHKIQTVVTQKFISKRSAPTTIDENEG